MAEEETIKEAMEVLESVSAESSAPEADGNTAADELIQERASEPSPENESEVRIKAAEDKCKEYYDRLLRVSAEFENYKKRSAREADNFRKFANESILKDFLPVVDNLERAIQSSANIGEDGKSCISEGVELTLKEILRVLERYGVKPVEAVGKPFDPLFHEAVMQEVSDEMTENTVLKEFQKGYALHERLLRPAMVVVSKKA